MEKLWGSRTYRKKIIKTPNILAKSHLFEDTELQYLSNSLWAPVTLSTTSSVLASIRSLAIVSSSAADEE